MPPGRLLFYVFHCLVILYCLPCLVYVFVYVVHCPEPSRGGRSINVVVVDVVFVIINLYAT